MHDSQPGSDPHHARAAERVVWVLALGVLVLVAMALVFLPAGQALAEGAPATAVRPPAGPLAATSPPTRTYTVTLPLVVAADPLRTDALIWLDALPPATPQVVLFRRTLVLDRPLDGATLTLLADTRYEVWLDGTWLGRGPARYSHHLAEYDVHDLGHLAAGSHVLAVLVQWAPNVRRSESLTPFLVGHLAGRQDGWQVVAVRTGPEWRVLAADAWCDEAAQVHALDLIGPTELLDLRALPDGWMLPLFDDAGWTQAAVRPWSAVIPVQVITYRRDFYTDPLPDTPTVVSAGASWSLVATRFRPRTIPFPVEVAMPLDVLDAGCLSPGRSIVELVPPLADPISLPLEVLEQTTVTLEALIEADAVPPFDLRLDGTAPAWQKVGDARPDVIVATTSLPPGSHQVTLSDLPADGATFSLSTTGVDAALPFAQGTHAGRRLLLAEPVSRPEQVQISAGEGLTVEFHAVITSPATYVVLDLGRIVHGRLVAQVTGPAGSVLDAGWSQRLWQGRRPLPYPGSLNRAWNQVDSWVLDGSERTLSTIDARAGRYLLLAAWNQDGSGAPIRLENLRVLEERYPVATHGAFTSGDPFLDLAWQIGVDTLYPNMVDAYADTPWRERGQWWGDAFVEDRINQVSMGDTALLRRGLTFMALAFVAGRPDALAPNGDDSHMLDYGMLWVQSLRAYWERTGDAAFLKSNYAALQALMAHLAGYANADTGLLDLPRAHWSQTALIDWLAYSSRFGQSAAVNAMYYGALDDAAAIAALVGDEPQAAAWLAEADLVRDGVNAHLFSAGEGRYVATIYAGERWAPSVHAQAWPLAYGLVPEAEVDRVAEALLELLAPDPAAPNVDIYGMYWVLEALARAGRIEEALALVHSYYGHLVDLGATTWWEGFYSGPHYTASLCHGWGGAPTWFLSTHVLGARQVAPGRWLVRPALAGVEEAAGAIPLPEGNLEVAWKRRNCREVTLHLTAPQNTAGRVALPLDPGATRLSLDGVVVWDHGQAYVPGVSGVGGEIHVELESGGGYVFEAQHDCNGPDGPGDE